mmetsp:Transcript_25570/g.74629  ORF Transcript_25570/g.74629 Transcript_25570/m.74629 type:complete len:210 (+) Transcript_25570:239-868(+)
MTWTWSLLSSTKSSCSCSTSTTSWRASSGGSWSSSQRRPEHCAVLPFQWHSTSTLTDASSWRAHRPTSDVTRLQRHQDEPWVVVELLPEAGRQAVKRTKKVGRKMKRTMAMRMGSPKRRHPWKKPQRMPRQSSSNAWEVAAKKARAGGKVGSQMRRTRTVVRLTARRRRRGNKPRCGGTGARTRSYPRRRPRPWIDPRSPKVPHQRTSC